MRVCESEGGEWVLHAGFCDTAQLIFKIYIVSPAPLLIGC